MIGPLHLLIKRIQKFRNPIYFLNSALVIFLKFFESDLANTIPAKII